MQRPQFGRAAAPGARSVDLKDVGALREPRGLLDMKRHQVDQLGMSWATRPELPMVDALKIEPPARIAFLARQLRTVGIHELDELKPAGPDGQRGRRTWLSTGKGRSYRGVIDATA